jgi:F-type H+-transporting ATPase subunit beta
VVRGTVLEIQFETAPPPLGAAVTCAMSEGRSVIAVTQAHLERGRVRAISIDVTRGLRCGSAVVSDGEPLSIPVGEELLGRVIDLHGSAIDGGANLDHGERRSIYRAPPGANRRLSGGALYPTGIKVIDFFCPFTSGGRAAVFGGESARPWC